jgi:CPA2 family monovalent cation:H+ antiporter-2
MSRYLWPVMLITFVVITGKLIANTVGTYLTGRGGTTALEVGTAMPQPGEFSLAMVKVGADHGAVGGALTPVITAVTVVSSMVYPIVFGSAHRLERLIERRSPLLMRRQASVISSSVIVAQQLMRTEGRSGRRVKRHLSIAMINLGVIGLVVVAGVVMLNFAEPLAVAMHVSARVFGLIMGGIVVTLSVPPGLSVWSSLSAVSEEITQELLLRRVNIRPESFTASFAALVQQTFFAIAMFVLAVWATPFLMELVSVGKVATPLSVLIIVATMGLTARIAVKIHNSLEETFERTFFGGPDEDEGARKGKRKEPADQGTAGGENDDALGVGYGD